MGIPRKKTVPWASSARVLAVILAATVVVQAADPTIGTWKLDVAKSKFNPGPAFKSETRIYEVGPEGVKVTIRTIEADRQSVVVRCPANYDGIFIRSAEPAAQPMRLR